MPVTYVLPAEFGSSALKGVDINTGRRTPKLRIPGTLGIRGVADPRISALPTCVKHAKFGSSATKGVCINRREPPKSWDGWGTAVLRQERGYYLTSRFTLLPHTCYPAEFGRSGSNDTSFTKEIRVKNLTPRVPPLKVTEGHRNRHGSIRYL